MSWNKWMQWKRSRGVYGSTAISPPGWWCSTRHPGASQRGSCRSHTHHQLKTIRERANKQMPFKSRTCSSCVVLHWPSCGCGGRLSSRPGRGALLWWCWWCRHTPGPPTPDNPHIGPALKHLHKSVLEEN